MQIIEAKLLANRPEGQPPEWDDPLITGMVMDLFPEQVSFVIAIHFVDVPGVIPLTTVITDSRGVIHGYDHWQIGEAGHGIYRRRAESASRHPTRTSIQSPCGPNKMTL